MKRIYFSVISLLAVGVLVMACHKNTLEEDLPERYLLASEMRIISLSRSWARRVCPVLK